MPYEEIKNVILEVNESMLSEPLIQVIAYFAFKSHFHGNCKLAVFSLELCENVLLCLDNRVRSICVK